MHGPRVSSVFLLSLCAKLSLSGYVYEEELIYGTFPEGFKWGVATGSYQVWARASKVAIKLREFKGFIT